MINPPEPTGVDFEDLEEVPIRIPDMSKINTPGICQELKLE